MSTGLYKGMVLGLVAGLIIGVTGGYYGGNLDAQAPLESSSTNSTGNYITGANSIEEELFAKEFALNYFKEFIKINKDKPFSSSEISHVNRVNVTNSIVPIANAAVDTCSGPGSDELGEIGAAMLSKAVANFVNGLGYGLDNGCAEVTADVIASIEIYTKGGVGTWEGVIGVLNIKGTLTHKFFEKNSAGTCPIKTNESKIDIFVMLQWTDGEAVPPKENPIDDSDWWVIFRCTLSLKITFGSLDKEICPLCKAPSEIGI